MRPWSLRPLTLGLAERVVLTGNPDTIIAWRWWCRGILRRRWAVRAATDAADYVNREFKPPASPGGVRRKTDRPKAPAQDIMETACHAALALGGTPDQWRAALWSDVRFMLDWKAWSARAEIAATDKRKPRPGPPPKRSG